LLGAYADKPELHVECSEELERADSVEKLGNLKTVIFRQNRILNESEIEWWV